MTAILVGYGLSWLCALVGVVLVEAVRLCPLNRPAALALDQARFVLTAWLVAPLLPAILALILWRVGPALTTGNRPLDFRVALNSGGNGGWPSIWRRRTRA